MVFIKSLHKKGIWTTSLIILTESITLSNAVTFWSSYQSWSNKHFGDKTNSQHQHQHQHSHYTSDSNVGSATKKKFGNLSILPYIQLNNNKDKTSSQDCPADNNKQVLLASSSTSPLLHSRKHRARTASNTRTCSQTMYDCCQENCSTCFDSISLSATVASASATMFDLRGGGMDHNPLLDTLTKGMSESSSSSAASSTTALPTTPYNLPLNVWKIIFQILLTTMNVLCWYLPLRAPKFSEHKLTLSLANAFSGGVFLSLAFGHLIPECIHGFEGMNEALPFMIVLGGYLLIFFVEKVAFDAHSLMHVEEEEEEHGGNKGKKVVVVKKEQQEDVSTAAGEGLNSGRSAVILLGALAVHSILEMTALGLADTFGDSALLSLSIALHQPAESIALLVAFLKSGMPKPQIIKYLSVFSTMGPIGVALGMIVKEFAAPIVDSIMLATVAGTFVYVGATEVIPEEWEEQEHKWKKFFALMGGIVSIFAITQYTMTLEGVH